MIETAFNSKPFESFRIIRFVDNKTLKVTYKFRMSNGDKDTLIEFDRANIKEIIKQLLDSL